MRRIHISQPFVAALLAAGFAVACNGTPLSTTTTISAIPTAPSLARTVNASTCATGDGVNDACSCDADAHSYCAGFYAADWQSYARAHGYTTASWKYGLLDCLGQQPVATACTASLDRRESLNAQMMAACSTYCKGTSPQPGAEPCVDHLKLIYNSLDSACRAALDAHENAKAVQARGPL